MKTIKSTTYGIGYIGAAFFLFGMYCLYAFYMGMKEFIAYVSRLVSRRKSDANKYESTLPENFIDWDSVIP